MRADVGARLNETPSRGLVRRLALASMGGGSMWAGVVGIAAAHKAAAITAGLSLVLGGSVAAEASGVGPAMRTAVSSAVQSEVQGPDEDLVVLQEQEDEDENRNQNQNEQVNEASEHNEGEGSGHEECYAATAHARGGMRR